MLVGVITSTLLLLPMTAGTSSAVTCTRAAGHGIDPSATVAVACMDVLRIETAED